MTPVRTPSRRNAASNKYVIVVLPFVPVIPTIFNSAAGFPYVHAESAPRCCRGLSTTMTARPVASASARPAGSVNTATAPRDAACAECEAPWVNAPGSAAKMSPGCTARESRVIPVTLPVSSTCVIAIAPSAVNAAIAPARGRETKGRGATTTISRQWWR